MHMPGRAAIKLRYTKLPSLQYVLRCCAALLGKQGSQEQLHVLRRCVLVDPALHHTPAKEPLVVYSTASLTGGAYVIVAGWSGACELPSLTVYSMRPNRVKLVQLACVSA